MVVYITMPPCQACEDLAEVPGTADYNATVFADIPATWTPTFLQTCGRHVLELTELTELTVQKHRIRPTHLSQNVLPPAASLDRCEPTFVAKADSRNPDDPTLC